MRKMIVLPNKQKKSYHYSFALQHCCYRKCIHFSSQAIPDDYSSGFGKWNGMCITVFRVGAFQHYNFNFHHFHFLGNISFVTTDYETTVLNLPTSKRI